MMVFPLTFWFAMAIACICFLLSSRAKAKIEAIDFLIGFIPSLFVLLPYLFSIPNQDTTAQELSEGINKMALWFADFSVDFAWGAAGGALGDVIGTVVWYILSIFGANKIDF